MALTALANAPLRPTAASRVGIVQHVVAPSALASALTTLVRAAHFVPSKGLFRELGQLPRLDAAHQLIPFGARKGREVRCFPDCHVAVLTLPRLGTPNTAGRENRSALELCSYLLLSGLATHSVPRHRCGLDDSAHARTRERKGP